MINRNGTSWLQTCRKLIRGPADTSSLKVIFFISNLQRIRMNFIHALPHRIWQHNRFDDWPVFFYLFKKKIPNAHHNSLCAESRVPHWPNISMRPPSSNMIHINHKCIKTQAAALFGQICFPLIQVLRTTPCLSNTTKSAWAPGRKVPFLLSIPKHLFHRWANNTTLCRWNDWLCRIIRSTLDGLAQRTARKGRQISDTFI